ncbi:hypothetical protein K1719_018273 [Acacia pycnantha]|nr:hypothetical protein K1719_018273 [Acacia pycnantha]
MMTEENEKKNNLNSGIEGSNSGAITGASSFSFSSEASAKAWSVGKEDIDDMDVFSLGVDGPLHRHAIKTDKVYPMCYAPIRVRRAISVGLPRARQIEQEAYAAAGDSAFAEDDGIEILRAYSKEISHSMRYGAMLPDEASSVARQIEGFVQIILSKQGESNL